MFKYLGIYLPENLKWNEHVNNLYKITQNSSCQILKSFITSSASILTKLFKIYVRPKLEYNTPVWSPYSKKKTLLRLNLCREILPVLFIIDTTFQTPHTKIGK